ncbi:MAG: hypothetical protein ACRDV9_15505, partial [Acidimicrobiia bacterium]
TEVIEEVATDLVDALASSDDLTTQALQRIEEYRLSVQQRLADAKASAVATASRAMAAASGETPAEEN